jgi:SAM-dependent methyltransferase
MGETMREYWNGRFRNEGRVWGDVQSRTAVHAEAIFRKYGVKRLLVPGAGYGRNAEYFAAFGYEVTGIEISEEALMLVRKNTAVKYYPGSVLAMPLDARRYEAVYCYNILHLFRRDDRGLFLRNCFEALEDGGIAFFVVFSEKEAQFGKGTMVEENTFESKPGRPVHFFTEDDLVESFRGFELLETGLMEDPEAHGTEGPHVHWVRFISARKWPTDSMAGNTRL